MREEEDGVIVLDLGKLFQQEEELRRARIMIAEKTEEESISQLEDPEQLPKLRIANKGVATLADDGRKVKVLRNVMENHASGERFIFDVGIIKAQRLMRELNRFCEQVCG